MLGSRRKIAVCALAVVLGLAAGTALFAGQSLSAGAFLKGTFVAGQDVGGLSTAEAARLLAPQTEAFAGSEFNFTADSIRYPVKTADLGAALDVDGFLDQVMEEENKRGLWERISSHTRRDYPLKVPIAYDQKQYDQAMIKVSESLERPVKIGRVKWDAEGNPSLVPGQDGVKIDRLATFNSLPDFYQGEKTIAAELVTEFEAVGVNAGELMNLVELGAFTTYFSVANVNRSSNLRMAAAALQGAVVPPGREFSFNVAVGPREFSTGYKEAMIILQNEFKPGVGGGICQVSSTLYNAVLMANLPVVERHNHSVAVAYALPGTDATVTYMAKDLRFKNDTDGPVCIKTTVQGGRLTVQVLGPRGGSAPKIKIEREITAVTEFNEIRKADPELLLGEERVDHEGVKGYRVRTYRVVYNEDGTLLKRERLSSDVYKPLDKLVFVGTKAPPDQVIPEEPPVVAPDPGDVDTPTETPGTPAGDTQEEGEPSAPIPTGSDSTGG